LDTPLVLSRVSTAPGGGSAPSVSSGAAGWPRSSDSNVSFYAEAISNLS
jgi:hypothetical protein